MRGQRGTIMPNGDETFLFVLYICCLTERSFQLFDNNQQYHITGLNPIPVILNPNY
jgi:hypothetical protein